MLNKQPQNYEHSSQSAGWRNS